MQKPIANLNFNCQKHQQQKIMFICAVNDWHFEPLCQKCTPDHTQNHGKRLKINLQSVEQLNSKSEQGKITVCNKYAQQITKAKEALLKASNSQQILVKQLTVVEEKITAKIHEYFEGLRKELIKSSNHILEQQTQKLTNMIKNLEKQVEYISQISQGQDFNSWKNSVKKVYFSDKIQTYIQESQQIIQEYQASVKSFYQSNLNQIYFQKNQNRFFDSLVKLIKEFFHIQLTETNGEKSAKNAIGMKGNNKIEAAKDKPLNNLSKPGSKPTKPVYQAPLPKVKSKICKTCNEQMQYLTQNKKHLICKFCNTKQRNYTNKKL